MKFSERRGKVLEFLSMLIDLLFNLNCLIYSLEFYKGISQTLSSKDLLRILEWVAVRRASRADLVTQFNSRVEVPGNQVKYGKTSCIYYYRGVCSHL